MQRILRLASVSLLACALLQGLSAREPLTFEERVDAQEAIERVYYEHRIWPEQNPGPKPPFETLVPRSVIEAKVTDTLKKSAALDTFWQRPILPEQLQAEMDRMAKQSQDPAMLRELFEALGNDPYLAAECLARPVLADRLIHHAFEYDRRFHRDVRTEAEEALKKLSPSHFGPCPLGEIRSVVVTTEDTATRLPNGGSEQEDRSRLTVSNEELEKMRALLPPIGGISGLKEETSCFYLALTKASTPTSLEVDYLVFRKRSFSHWWGDVAPTLSPPGSMGIDRDYVAPEPSRRPPMPDADCEDAWLQCALSDALDGRYFHTAVWTGTEMIIWGGVNGGKFDTGGRYDPTLDSWTPTSRGGDCPSGRYNHCAAWTGTEMIVWGGVEEGGGAITGGRYDPITDTWTATSISGDCPTGRSYPKCVWTGTELIIWGGYQSSTIQLNTGGRYDPSTNSWAATSTGAGCPEGRYRFTAVWTGSEMIVWGGYHYGSSFLNSGGRYDPTSDTWIATSISGDCPSPREEHSAVWTGSEMIVWGGWQYPQVNDGGRYDPGTDTWTQTSTGVGCPWARYGHTAVWTDDKMIVWGGSGGVTGGLYDPATDSWSATSTGTDCPTYRRYHTAVWTGTEMIVWGGSQFAEPVENLDDGARYDPDTDSWAAVAPVDLGSPRIRSQSCLVWTGAEVIVWGGETVYSPTIDLDTGGRYDPALDAWSATSTGAGCPAPSHILHPVWTGTEMILWSSGDDNSGSMYDPVSDTWTVMSTGSGCPERRDGFAVVWTGTEMIIWGGYVTGTFLHTGGRYDPTSDSWTPTSTGGWCPSGRMEPKATWTGSKAIVWGGVNLTPYPNTGGLYDPVTDTWSATSTGANCPPGRRYSTLVWTGTEMITWGGFNGSILDDGGRYDPASNTWSTMSSGTGCPSPRYSMSLVWSGSEVFVWGGNLGGTLEAADGSRYDPETDAWNTMSTEGYCPSARYSHGAVWANDRMIVWGGSPTTITGGMYTPGPQPTVITAPILQDPDLCEEGISVSWDADPADWNDSGTGDRGYRVWRNGIAITTGGCAGVFPFGTNSCADDTVPANGTIRYGIQYINTCNGSGSSPSAYIMDEAFTDPVVIGAIDGCEGYPEVLSTTAYATYQWRLDGGDIAGATDQTCDASTGGDYTVAVSDTNGCTGESAIHTLAFHPLPAPTVAGNSTGCADPGVTLSTQAFESYQWLQDGLDMVGETDSTVLVTESGSYSVRVADEYGCAGTSTEQAVAIQPTVLTSPTQLTVEALACSGAIVTPVASPVLAWSDVPDEFGYEWEVWDGAGCTGSLAANGTTGADIVSAAVSPPLPPGGYSWQARALGNGGATQCDSPWACGCAFDICAVLPSPVLTSVDGQACGGAIITADGAPTLAWSDIDNEAGYEWEIWDGPGCTGSLTTSGSTAADVVTAIVNPALLGGDYPWRVRSMGDGTAFCYGDWACGCAFTVPCTVLPSPGQLTVDGQACGGAIDTADPSPTLAWSDVPLEIGYEWEVWDGAGCTGTLVASGTTGNDAASVAVSPNLFDGDFSWRVRALGDSVASCDGPWTCGCDFTVTCTEAGAPMLLSVDGQACGTGIATTDPSPTLEWADAGDDGGYEWQIWSGPVGGPSSPTQTTLDPTDDSFLRGGTKNANEGDHIDIQIANSGPKRGLIRFDQAQIEAAVGGGTLVSASLELTIRSTGSWGTDGRYVDLHRVTEDWTEMGVTWSCPIDTDTSNGQPDCAVQWDGGTFDPTPTDSLLHTNDLSGTVQYDVTSDVQAFLSGTDNYGWLIKHYTESAQGNVTYRSRDWTEPTERPVLVLTVQDNSGDCVGTLLAEGTTGTDVVTADVTPDLWGGTFVWRVRALGGAVTCDGPWTCGCPFSVDCVTLPGPALTSVDGQACGGAVFTTDTTPDLAWDDVLGDDGYEWEVWDGADCTGTVAASGSTSQDITAATPSALPAGDFSWRVRAVGDGTAYCTGSWSCGCDFTVCPELPAVSLVTVDGQACGGAITTSDGTPLIVWSDVAGETGYTWEVWDGAGCSGGLAASGSTGVDGTSVSVSPILQGGDYTWRVQPLGDGTTTCDGPWTCGCGFTVPCSNLSSPSLISVDSQSCGGAIFTMDNTPVLLWSNITDNSGFEWEVWDGAGCSGGLAASGATPSNTTWTNVSPSLTSGTYTWRIRALGDGTIHCDSAWTCGCEFQVCIELSPTLPLTVDGQGCGGAITTSDGTPELTWTNVTDEQGFEWEVWDGSNCTGAVMASGATAADVTSATVSPALTGGSYSWRVRAIGDGTIFCDGDWTCGCSFDTPCLPLASSSLASVDGQACGGAITTADGSPALIWTDVDDEAGYEWEIWDGSGCTGTIVANGATAADIVTAMVAPSLSGGTYSWRVKALGDGTIRCDGPWTCGCDFTVPCVTLGSPALITVDGQACGGAISTPNTSPPLVWEDIDDESGYEWEIWNGPGCTGGISASGSTGADVASATPTPLPVGDYSWSVRAIGDGDAFCDGAWTCGCDFTITCTILPAPTLSTVAGQTCGGAIFTTDETPTLAWADVAGETGYAWEVWDGSGCTGSLVDSGMRGANGTSANVYPAIPDGTYTWRVMAIGDGVSFCDSPWTCGCEFEVDCYEVAAPTQISVDGEACGGTITIDNSYPTLLWSDVSWEDGFEWEVWDGPSCTGTRVASGTTGMHVTSATPTIPGGTFTWRVRGLGHPAYSCDGIWSCGCEFTNTACLVLPGPEQTFVDGQACGSYIPTLDDTPILEWDDIFGEVGYEWEVYTGVLCSGSLVASGSTVADVLSVGVSPSLADGTYHWRVRGLGDGSATCDGEWRCGCPFTLGAPSCDTTLLADPTISVDTTWDLAGSPYIVSGTLTVNPGVALDVDAGVIVKFDDDASAVINGTLNLNGTDTDLVVLGSLNDHSLCGPSTGGTGIPDMFDWGGVLFAAGSSASIDNSLVRHAQNALEIKTSNPFTCTDSLIEMSSPGLWIQEDAAPVFTNLDLSDADLIIEGNSTPSFAGGVWNTTGYMPLPGSLLYGTVNPSDTPDPSFNGVTIHNFDAFGMPNALMIDTWYPIEGTTHWSGIDFWFQSDANIAATGQVDAFDTTLLMRSGVELDVSGTLNLGSPGTTTTVTSGESPAFMGDWMGIRYRPGSFGSVTDATVAYAFEALEIETNNAFSSTNTTLEKSQPGLWIKDDASPAFTNLNLMDADVWIEGNSTPSFSGGVWDTTGEIWLPGMIWYGSGSSADTPDPSFTGVTIQNFDTIGSRNALQIDASNPIEGTTHWSGIDFLIVSDAGVDVTGRVDAFDTTLFFRSSRQMEVLGTLNIGSSGHATVITSDEALPSMGDWSGIRYRPGSFGSVNDATIEYAMEALEIETNNPFACSNSIIQQSQPGVWIKEDASPAFTNLNLMDADVWIEGNSTPSFSGGVWDTTGEIWLPGMIWYGSGSSANTPDPSFSGVTIQNFDTIGSRNALQIDASNPIEGTTHWSGIDFWFQWNANIAATGHVDAFDTTLFMANGVRMNVEGTLNLGSAGTSTLVESDATTPSPGDWDRIRYLAGSAGAVTDTTLRHGTAAIEAQTTTLSIEDSRFEFNITGLEASETGTPRIEWSAFEDNDVGVRVLDSAQPDLGGGALSSAGYNTLIGTAMSVENLSANPITAQTNWWGCPTTIEMDAGASNITLIYDAADDGMMGAVDYSGWLGGSNRTILCTADTGGGARDVVVAWTQEISGPLAVMRGTDPQALAQVDSASGAAWTDVGGLDDPDPVVYYRISGPCP